MGLAPLRAMMRWPHVLFAANLLLASACGPSPVDDDVEDIDPVFEFRTPVLTAVAPTEIALGNTIHVIGSDFLDPAMGSSFIELTGVFTDDHGGRHTYHDRLEINYDNPSIATLDFTHVFFTPNVDQTGVFDGKAAVVSRLETISDPDGISAERISEAIPVTLRVLPSISVKELRSVTQSGCAPVSTSTIGDQDLSLGFKAIGLGQASPHAPIKFRVNFLSPALSVRYIKNDAYATWPIDIPLDDSVAATAPDGENRLEVDVTSGSVLDLNPLWQRQEVRVSPPVKIGQDHYNEVLLQRFATGVVNGQGPMNALVMVEAQAADGTSARRLISLEVHNEWEIRPYDGNAVLIERYAPEAVTGCFPGGDIGRDLAYTEGESTARSRSLSFRWDVNVANSLGVQVGTGGMSPIQVAVNGQVTWSETFGVDVSESVSSESHRNLNLSAHILPSYYGMCYRQLEMVEREVDVVYHNACGDNGVVGQTVLKDWNFAFDIATGPECPPQTNLPPGESFVE